MTSREWLQKAKDEKFAIGAFNVGNLETFKAIVRASANKKSPVIIESSPGETKWMGAANIADIAENYSREYGAPIIVNLDHSETLEDCMEAIAAGYGLIHFDGSKLSYEENLNIAKRVVAAAHAKGLVVEGEIDRIVGKGSEVHKEMYTTDELRSGYTDPNKAKEFVEASGVDIFAAFFGNIHGTVPPGGQPPLDIGLVQKVNSVTGKFLSLHGGSGIDAGDIKLAIAEGGINKVNVNTDLRVAYRAALEKVLKDDPDIVALYKILPEVVSAVQEVVERWIDICGSANKI